MAQRPRHHSRLVEKARDLEANMARHSIDQACGLDRVVRQLSSLIRIRQIFVRVAFLYVFEIQC